MDATVADVSRCIRAGADPNVPDKYQRTPLDLAAIFNKNPAVITTLLKAGANPNVRANSQRSPLHYAAGHNKNPAVITTLLKAGIDPNVRDKYQLTPLHWAALLNENPAVIITALLKAGANPNALGSSLATRLTTPLHLAAARNPAAITALLKAGANPNARNEKGKTPLQLAAEKKDPALMAAFTDEAVAALAQKEKRANDAAHKRKIEERLRAARVSCEKWNTVGFFRHANAAHLSQCLKTKDPNARDDQGRTPLHTAAMSSKHPAVLAVLAVLSKAGADLDARDKKGRTPLHLAAVFGKSPAIINALVKAGADVTALDGKGRTPLQFAEKFGKTPALVAALKKAKETPSASPEATSQASCDKWNTAAFFKHARLADLTRCLETKDPNARNEKGRTPLHYAAQGGAPGFVTALARAGALVDARDKRGRWTPLHLAAWFGKSQAVVQALVDAGADPEATDKAGKTPWDYVKENPVLKGLHPRPAKVSCKNWNTKSFFKRANAAAVSRCLKAGAKVGARDETGATPLHLTAQHGKTPTVVAALVQAGARVSARDETGATPLHTAAVKSTTPAVVQALLDARADPEAKDEAGKTPWDYVKENPALKVFHPRLAKVSCEDWNTASFFERANAADVSRCLKAGAKVSTRDESAATPLHVAASRSEVPAVVQALLDAGANPAAKDKQGKVPWDYAKTNRALKGTEIYWQLNEGRFD